MIAWKISSSIGFINCISTRPNISAILTNYLNFVLYLCFRNTKRKNVKNDIDI